MDATFRVIPMHSWAECCGVLKLFCVRKICQRVSAVIENNIFWTKVRKSYTQRRKQEYYHKNRKIGQIARNFRMMWTIVGKLISTPKSGFLPKNAKFCKETKEATALCRLENRFYTFHAAANNVLFFLFISIWLSAFRIVKSILQRQIALSFQNLILLFHKVSPIFLQQYH